ncbi:MAG: beta-phosphoglucomutase family hydrolase [Candidatus Lokiarchaeota archaeon]|nr:beta-phosphoglucomutase family hydrolase [Candidatus Harpocratesius repetitus]
MKRISSLKAVIFDLDGVITQTASLHCMAWKKMFDDYLKSREKRFNEPFFEFNHESDYLPFVDGKPRYKGVQSFLESRNIKIPYGCPTDSESEETICGLGNRKNKLINEILYEQGVDLYSSTLRLIQELRSQGVKIGVASSSKNCKHVLNVAHITHLFDTIVDGTTIKQYSLQGKPAPDLFLTACHNLKVPYFQSVIVEDAVSGVQAGTKGHFGLVIGVARHNNHENLRQNGADIVVSDLNEISIEDIKNWFENGLPQRLWKFETNEYQNDKEKVIETLCSIGNGYFGSRGVQIENSRTKFNYPGTYLAGVYNKLNSKIEGKILSIEDLVNVPNWILLTFKNSNNNTWFDINNYIGNSERKIVLYKKGIDLRDGISYRDLIIEDLNGKRTEIQTKIFASHDNPHIGVLDYKVKPLNYSGKFIFKSSIDGNIRNEGVDRYRSFQNQHLKYISSMCEKNLSYLTMKTSESNILITEWVKLKVLKNSVSIKPEFINFQDQARIDTTFAINLKKNEVANIQKIVVLYTSNHFDSADPIKMARLTLKNLPDFSLLLKNHREKWHSYWERMDIQLIGDRFVQQAIRLHSYHLLSTASLVNQNFDFGIPARGLTGESYHGHIFWDEVFIFPFYNLFFPEITRALLLYRYYRLLSAKINAEENNFKGAMFPWQSGRNGEETTQKYHFNPKSGKWDNDFSYLQKHVSLAIAYNIWNYFKITQDFEFLKNYGLEIFIEIVHFWVDNLKINTITKKYDLSEVMGPDEFHEKMPNGDRLGLINNAYTNIMVCWLLEKAVLLLNLLGSKKETQLLNRFQIQSVDLQKWNDIRQNLSISIDKDGIIEQFVGYFNLKEFNWTNYKKKYGNISRLDRILKSENLNPDFYKVSKQPDVLMAFYLLSQEEIMNILQRFGSFSYNQLLEKNFDYYLPRTSHGSTLSKIVFSHLAEKLNNHSLGWQFYINALESDIFDIQGGTTGEGIHTGVMASSIIELIRSYGGFQIAENQIYIHPNLPNQIESIIMNFFYHGILYMIKISNQEVKIRLKDSRIPSITLKINHTEIDVLQDKWNVIPLL